jgi:hypothetical protein
MRLKSLRSKIPCSLLQGLQFAVSVVAKNSYPLFALRGLSGVESAVYALSSLLSQESGETYLLLIIKTDIHQIQII